MFEKFFNKPGVETEVAPAEEEKGSGAVVSPEGKVLSPEEVAKREREDRFTKEHVGPEEWREQQ
jgi:hypothetical protein